MFSWISSITKAGRALAAALTNLAGTVDEIDAQARRAAHLPTRAPDALPAPRRRAKAEATTNGHKE